MQKVMLNYLLQAKSPLRKIFVPFNAGSNVLGVISNQKALHELCKKYGATIVSFNCTATIRRCEQFGLWVLGFIKVGLTLE